MIVAARRFPSARPEIATVQGALAIERVAGRSVVTRAYAQSPLRLLTPGNHGRAAWVFTSTFGGGLVGGDALALSMRVGAGASAALLSQASTKVYRSDCGASLRLDATVDPDGLLAVLPDPVVPFAGSSYDQHQSFTVAAGAGLVIVDWFTCGRRGSGERWAFARYASRLDVEIDGRRVLLDALLLEADECRLDDRFGRFNVVALAAVVGAPLTAHAVGMIARCAAIPLAARQDLLLSASALPLGGCLVRAAGVSMEAVAQALRDVLDFVPGLLGDNPWLRKW